MTPTARELAAARGSLERVGQGAILLRRAWAKRNLPGFHMVGRHGDLGVQHGPYDGAFGRSLSPHGLGQLLPHTRWLLAAGVRMGTIRGDTGRQHGPTADPRGIDCGCGWGMLCDGGPQNEHSLLADRPWWLCDAGRHRYNYKTPSGGAPASVSDYPSQPRPTPSAPTAQPDPSTAWMYDTPYCNRELANAERMRAEQQGAADRWDDD